MLAPSWFASPLPVANTSLITSGCGASPLSVTVTVTLAGTYPGAVAVTSAVCDPSGQRSSTPVKTTATEEAPTGISTVAGAVASLRSELAKLTVTAASVPPLRDTVPSRVAPSSIVNGVNVIVSAAAG